MLDILLQEQFGVLDWAMNSNLKLVLKRAGISRPFFCARFDKEKDTMIED